MPARNCPSPTGASPTELPPITPRIAGRRAALLAVIAGAAALAGCSSAIEDVAPAPLGLSCVDDSPRCIDQRQSVLKAMVADPQRKWVREPASTEAYASGVRLFAYKAKKKELTCDELAHGSREAAGAGQALRKPGSGISQAQITRAEMLSAEVHKELAAELGRRCKGPVKRG